MAATEVEEASAKVVFCSTKRLQHVINVYTLPSGSTLCAAAVAAVAAAVAEVAGRGSRSAVADWPAGHARTGVEAWTGPRCQPRRR